MSTFEGLPAEILQRIFFFSDCNLALVETSGRIACKLSTQYVYHQVCKHHMLPELTIEKPVMGKPILSQHMQPIRVVDTRIVRKLFTFKWMTWSYYKSFILWYSDLYGCLCGDDCCKEPIKPNFSNPAAMPFQWVRDGHEHEVTHLPASTHIICFIPNKLLRMPWTKDSTEWLRFLVETTSMIVDWRIVDRKMDYPWATVAELHAAAIKNGDLNTVHLFNYTKRLQPYLPSLHQVRYAVIECGCNRSIVYDTMHAARLRGIQGKAWNCPVLHNWCKDAIRAGNPKGKWLELKLQELRTDIVVTSDSGLRLSMSGYMKAETGDYEDVPGDVLVVIVE